VLEVRLPLSDEEFQQYYDMRWRVLREPWTRPKESEKDEHEEQSVHLAAFRDGQMIGVGRVHLTSAEEAQIRYMAVEEEFRGAGAGGVILSGLEEQARIRGAKVVVLNARSTARGFYERHGYRTLDPHELVIDTIPHWRMSKTL
jgi:predicted GNAT family N-acyltransferase